MINAGNVITVPEKNVTIGGWVGTGYMILDPESGAGTYMIDGGAAGGVWLDLGFFLIAMLLTVILLGLLNPAFHAAIPYLMGIFLGKVFTMPIVVFLPEEMQYDFYFEFLPYLVGAVSLVLLFLSVQFAIAFPAELLIALEVYGGLHWPGGCLGSFLNTFIDDLELELSYC